MRPREAGPGQGAACYVAESSGIRQNSCAKSVRFEKAGILANPSYEGNSGESHTGLPGDGDFFGLVENLLVTQMLDFLADDFDFIKAFVALFLKD